MGPLAILPRTYGPHVVEFIVCVFGVVGQIGGVAARHRLTGGPIAHDLWRHRGRSWFGCAGGGGGVLLPQLEQQSGCWTWFGYVLKL